MLPQRKPIQIAQLLHAHLKALLASQQEKLASRDYEKLSPAVCTMFSELLVMEEMSYQAMDTEAGRARAAELRADPTFIPEMVRGFVTRNLSSSRNNMLGPLVNDVMEQRLDAARREIIETTITCIEALSDNALQMVLPWYTPVFKTFFQPLVRRYQEEYHYTVRAEIYSEVMLIFLLALHSVPAQNRFYGDYMCESVTLWAEIFRDLELLKRYRFFETFFEERRPSTQPPYEALFAGFPRETSASEYFMRRADFLLHDVSCRPVFSSREQAVARSGSMSRLLEDHYFFSTSQCSAPSSLLQNSRAYFVERATLTIHYQLPPHVALIFERIDALSRDILSPAVRDCENIFSIEMASKLAQIQSQHASRDHTSSAVTSPNTTFALPSLRAVSLFASVALQAFNMLHDSHVNVAPHRR